MSKEVVVPILLNPLLHCVEMVRLGLGRVHDVATVTICINRCMCVHCISTDVHVCVCVCVCGMHGCENRIIPAQFTSTQS